MQAQSLSASGSLLSNFKQTKPNKSGSLTEVIVAESGAIQPFQLLPVLAHCSSQNRWLMWFSPSQMMSKELLVSCGLENSPVLHIATQKESQKALCLRAIKAAKSHIIIEWIGYLGRETRQQLKLLAEQSGTQVMLVRIED